MVSKEIVGKRIAAYRIKCGLTQAQLGEKVYVSTQAVSKWEMGGAIPGIDVLLHLSQLFGCSINDLIEENRLIEQISIKPWSLKDGIYLYMDDQEYNCHWAKYISDNEIVRKNWLKFQWKSSETDVGKFVAEHSGVILEIGIGPGGGFVPSILHKASDRSIIISDLSPTIVREWRNLLEIQKGFHNLSFSAFNFCDIPFQNDCIDIITDGGGINNTIMGNKRKAYSECFRVLKPGGILISGGGMISKAEEQSLPLALQEEIRNLFPGCLDSDYDSLLEIGFSKVETVVTHGWDTKDDISDIATLALKYDSNIRFTGYIRYCYK